VPQILQRLRVLGLIIEEEKLTLAPRDVQIYLGPTVNLRKSSVQFHRVTFTTTSYPMGTGALSMGVQRPGGDHSPPSSAEVKECVEL